MLIEPVIGHGNQPFVKSLLVSAAFVATYQ